MKNWLKQKVANLRDAVNRKSQDELIKALDVIINSIDYIKPLNQQIIDRVNLLKVKVDARQLMGDKSDPMTARKGDDKPWNLSQIGRAHV